MDIRPSDAIWPAFGQWLKTQREQAKLTQGDAAKGAGIDRQQWYRIESGKSGSRRDTVIALANAVNADVGEALRRSGYGNTESNEPIQQLAGELAKEIMAAGFDDLDDENLKRSFVEDMKTIAASMLRRKLEEQRDRK